MSIQARSAVAPRDRISGAIAASKSAGQPAIVAFLTAGYPSRERFIEHLRAVAAGADVVEIGVPFTDPMADGVTIQRSSQSALAQGVTLKWILEALQSAGPIATPLLLMSYLNPLLAYGFERLAADSAAAGVCGFIVPDLPFDESEEFRTAIGPHGLALVQMATPVTTAARLAQLGAHSDGFVYAVTMTGTTGRNVAVPHDVLDYLDRVKRASRVPVCAGFGIRSHEQVARLAAHVDGVIVGSALVEVLERGEDPTAWLRALRGPAQG